MMNVPTLVLYRVPPCLSPEWQRVFASLVQPVYQVRCLLNDPCLLQMTEKVLHRCSAGVDGAKEQMKQTLDGMAAVAPKTFDAGWAIRRAVEPIAAQLGCFRVVKMPASPSLSQFLHNLREQRDTFPERRLLEALLEAVTAERGIDLTIPAPAHARPTADASRGETGDKKTKGKNIDARMLKVMAENPECLDWSSRQWAAELSCAESTVREGRTWKVLLPNARAMRVAAGAERMDSSRTNPRGRRKVNPV